MRNPRIEATWSDLAVIRQTLPVRQMPHDEPFPFFPVQTAPAFPLHRDGCRCNDCK
jgi:hypothetical protein